MVVVRSVPHGAEEVSVEPPCTGTPQVIRMCEREGHSVAGLDEVHLLEPEARRGLPQDHRQGVVLDEGVWKLDEMPKLERPNAHRAAGDGFVRISVEERGVVLDFEVLHPLRLPLSKWRAKPSRTELTEIVVDTLRLTFELIATVEETVHVIEAVDANLESTSA